MKKILIAARALIADPKHWTKEVEARDSENVEVYYSDPRAAKFCSIGAIRKVCNGDIKVSIPTRVALRNVAKKRGFSLITEMNDHSSHEQVLSYFDQAIQEAK